MTTDIEAKGKESFKLHQRFLELKAQGMVVYLEMAACLLTIRKEKVYKDMGCETFKEYLALPELGLSEASAYYMMDIYRTFCVRLGLHPGELQDVYWTKLREILGVVNKENCLEWVGKARELSRSDLITEVELHEDKIKRNHNHVWKDETWQRCVLCAKVRVKPVAGE